MKHIFAAIFLVVIAAVFLVVVAYGTFFALLPIVPAEEGLSSHALDVDSIIYSGDIGMDSVPMYTTGDAFSIGRSKEYIAIADDTLTYHVNDDSIGFVYDLKNMKHLTPGITDEEMIIVIFKIFLKSL